MSEQNICSTNNYIPQDKSCPKAKYLYDKRLGYWRTMVCNSCNCVGEECRRTYAKRKAAVMMEVIKEHNIDFWCTLHFTGENPPSHKAVRGILSQVLKDARDKTRKGVWKNENKSLKFHWTMDRTITGDDYNLLVWSTGFTTEDQLAGAVRRMIDSRSSGYQFRLSVMRPRSQLAVVKYVWKDQRDRSMLRVPTQEDQTQRIHGGCHLPGNRTMRQIWHDLTKKWYPETGVDQ